MIAAAAQIVGLVAVSVGAAIIAPAAGFIVGGLLLILLGVALARPKGSA
jgi:hypothetical protein